ncbi:hypothetical protein WMY93_022433 [Mugilogobius chulae]|uniref:Ig-like domain-containing protein n=1 Tax=Mugilogobius chulae TaxID=88201 RepID=A0AAW0N6Z5_9GOBI
MLLYQTHLRLYRRFNFTLVIKYSGSCTPWWQFCDLSPQLLSLSPPDVTCEEGRRNEQFKNQRANGGLKIEVKAHVKELVKAGDEVHLQCPLKASSEVLQVMWQKILPEETVTMATCLWSRHKLNPEFSRGIRLRGKGVKNCSLVVQNMMRQDEGCYLCLFITSSEVAHTGKICLQIHELHGSMINVAKSNSSGEKQVNKTVPGERIHSDKLRP